MGRADSPLRDRMVFVVGARRSGTHWLQRILAAHPKVDAVPGETYLFSHGLSPLAERLQHSNPASPALGKVYIERDEALDAMRALADAAFGTYARRGNLLVERTPRHAHELALIADVYPDSRAINIVRDGRDVARSLLAQEWGPTTLTEAAAEWRNTVRAAAGGPAELRLLDVGYERLQAEPAAVCEELCRWLEIAAGEAEVAAMVAEAGREGNLLGERERGAGTQKWRSELDAGQVAEIEAVAGPLLRELGYEPATAGATPAPARRRRGVRALAGAIARRLTGRRVPARDERRAHFRQARIDRIVAAIRGADAAAVAAELTEGASVTVASAGAVEGTAGPEGLRLLERALADDEALGWELAHAETNASWPTAAVVLHLRGPSGEVAGRVLTLTFAGEQVDAIAIHSFSSFGTRASEA